MGTDGLSSWTLTDGGRMTVFVRALRIACCHKAWMRRTASGLSTSTLSTYRITGQEPRCAATCWAVELIPTEAVAQAIHASTRARTLSGLVMGTAVMLAR